MKKLIMFLLLLLSSTAFSQVGVPDKFRATQLSDHKVTLEVTEGTGTVNWRTPPAPDTLRAIILVTMSPNGTAHARMGFIVREPGKPVVYLDCRKRALKLPQVGWGYEIVNPNYNQK